MATFQFRVRTKHENAPIYLKLSISRTQRFERKTGLVINPKDWNIKTSLPKQNNPNLKNLTSKLRGLEYYLQKQLNDASSDGVEVDATWLQFKIDLHFKRTNERKQSEYLIDAIQNVIDTANVRKNGTGGLGLSKSRVNSYKQLKKKILEFDGITKTKVKQVDKNYAQQFLSYLVNTRNYAPSYSQKKIDDLKTVCFDADLNGIEISKQLKHITSTKVKNEQIIFLTPNELKKIKDAEILNPSLDNARKWLLLGCAIGQRGSDLLNITYDNLTTYKKLDVIELTQKKTKTEITIPILDKVKEIIDNGLPYKISIQKFNEYVKKVCKIAEIDDLVKGSKKDKKLNRKVAGTYPKHELIGSHVCRRTFATNNYGILPTPLIMRITGHKTEKMLLTYIGKKGIDVAQQIADFYKMQELRNAKEPQLKVVKNVAN